MTPAPYTRDTVAIIRQQAEARTPALKIADAIGWDMERLLRIAARHSIDLSGAIVVSIKPSQACPLETDESLQVVLDGLTAQQVAIVRVLMRAQEGAFKTSRQIADQLGGNVSSEAVVHLIDRMRDQFDGSKWKITSLKRSNGGYRLQRRDQYGDGTRPDRSTYGEIDIGPSSTIDEIIRALPRRQSEIVRLLADRMGLEAMSSREIMTELGVLLSRNSINQAINRASVNMRKTRYRIEGNGRNHSNDDRGYRLVIKP